jgi:hypothetical protein
MDIFVYRWLLLVSIIIIIISVKEITILEFVIIFLPADELNAHQCLKSSILWHHVYKFNLKKNMRVHLQNDASADGFTKQLLEMGNSKQAIDELTQCIILPINLCIITAAINKLIDKSFLKSTKKLQKLSVAQCTGYTGSQKL